MSDERALATDRSDRERGSTASTDGESTRGGRATIGTYHPKAGARSAGGVAVFVREVVANLPTRPAYLYTEDGGVTADLRDGTVVPIGRATAWEALRKRARSSPLTLATVSNQLSESVAAFVNARLDGGIDHLERHVDVLFTHTLLDTLLLSNATSVPVVRLFHGCQRTSAAGRVLDSLSNPAARVANSEQTAREVAAKLGHDVDWVVYPGVDLDAFRPDREPAFERDEVSVLFVGRFVPEKGLYDLLDAFVGLEDRAHLYLAGRGQTARLRREIADRGLGSAVTVVGEVPHEELPPYYAAADIACLPTRYESFGMVNVEAMACGTPVVTTDLPGVRRYATDGETSLLVPPGEPARLRDALATLVESPERRRELGAAGRSVAEEFSWRVTAERLADVADAVAERE